MLTSEDFCNICSDKNRDKKSICVVEHISDVLAIESTGGYRGHILFFWEDYPRWMVLDLMN